MSDLPHIIVLGGQKLGLLYAKSLLAALAEGMLAPHELVIVEPERENPVTRELPAERYQWAHCSYADYLQKILREKKCHPDDKIVPDHTAPHTFFQTFLDLLASDFPHLSIDCSELTAEFGTPFELDLQPGIKAVSFAEWTCPLDCIEPSHCPAIDQSRSWDMGRKILTLKETYPEDHHALFYCEHLVKNVAATALAPLRHQYQALSRQVQAGQQPLSFIVATVSHCHGIIGRARIG